MKIGPQLHSVEIKPRSRTGSCDVGNVRGTSGLLYLVREESSLTWKSGIAEMVHPARAALQGNAIVQ